jgi:hypothetical protein
MGEYGPSGDPEPVPAPAEPEVGPEVGPEIVPIAPFPEFVPGLPPFEFPFPIFGPEPISIF